MNKNLKNVLRVLSEWDVLRYAGLELVEIKKFIDPQGGVWDLESKTKPIGPCGCIVQSMTNPYRTFLFCEKHPETGILILNFNPSKIYWISGK